MNIDEIIEKIATDLQAKKWSLVTAESCTGGLVAKALTDVAGSSRWFERGYVTYSNEAKQDLLNVPFEIIEEYGAVSEQTARAMAEGALKNSCAQVSVAITGIAGPGGGTVEKAVGTVWFAWASLTFPTTTKTQHFNGNRISIREQATKFVLQELNTYLCNNCQK